MTADDSAADSADDVEVAVRPLAVEGAHRAEELCAVPVGPRALGGSRPPSSPHVRRRQVHLLEWVSLVLRLFTSYPEKGSETEDGESTVLKIRR